MRGFFVGNGRTNVSGDVTLGKPTLQIGIRRLAMAKSELEPSECLTIWVVYPDVSPHAARGFPTLSSWQRQWHY